jgi:AbrB family looped-hinge helix DNA binding protein
VLRRKVVKIGGSLRVSIPPEILEALHIEEGDSLEYAATDGRIVIRKA